MLRSFYYAAFTPLLQKKITGGDYDKLEQWAKLWIFYISKVFLNAYFEHIQPTLIPKDQSEISQLLNIYLLEKVTYEIRYEMDNRPDWLAIPLKGLLFEVKKINSEKEE